MSYTCPVCGYEGLTKDPNYIGSFEICPSCAYQFGFTDRDKGITHAQWRRMWEHNGMIWQGKGINAPLNWDPKKQLKNLSLT